MQNMTFRDGGQKLVRITKRTARKLWGTKDMSLCPCKLRPGSPWRPNIDVFASEQKEKKFDSFVNQFEWFNCSGRETGNYTAFYLIERN